MMNRNFRHLLTVGAAAGALFSAPAVAQDPIVQRPGTPVPTGQLNDALFQFDFNQNSVADALETQRVVTPRSADLQTLFNALNGATVAQYYDALSQLSGSQYAVYMQSLGTQGQRLAGFLADQGECRQLSMDNGITCEVNAGGLWLSGNYGNEDIDASLVPNVPGSRSEQWSVLLGGELPVTTYGKVGLAIGYTTNDSDFSPKRSGSDGSIESDGYMLGLYAASDTGPVYVKLAGTYTSLDVESARNLQFGGLAGTARGVTNAEIWAASGELGFRIPVTNAFYLSPYAGVDFVNAELDSFSESGFGPGQLNIIETDEDYLTSELGLRARGGFGNFYGGAKVAWRHVFENDPGFFTASFTSAPGTVFRINGAPRADDFIVGGLNFGFGLAESTFVELGYEGWFSDVHTVNQGFVTLRHEFGAPVVAAPPPPPPAVIAPPPPPPPTPKPPVVTAPVCNKGPYIVFFDWDKSDITPAAAGVLDNAVAAYANCANVPIMLAGHTDRSGSTSYNEGLAQRRNASVRSYLANKGIPDARVTSQGFGETMPKVPTADGVREPQNRRVEITYGPGSGM